MQVFEFHFNPKGSPDRIFDSFCYEPENIYEKRLGSFFIVGGLKNILPQNLKLLQNLATLLKRKYYSAPIKFSPESSLKESLKKLNEFLEGILKGGDVSWLGNLNLAVLSLKNSCPVGNRRFSSGVDLVFTKVGTQKILLLKASQIIDIGKNLEFSEIEPYPLKIFSNIVSGRLKENDIILVLTEEVFELFKNQGLLIEIAKLTPKQNLGAGLKEIFNNKKEELLKISGICLLISLSEAFLGKEKEIIQAKEFSFRGIFSPINNVLKKVIKKPRIKVRRPDFGYLKNLTKGIISLALWPVKFLRRLIKWRLKIKFPKLPSFKIKISPTLKKDIILILIFIIFLTLGFFVFQGEKKENLRLARENLEEANSKKIQAESFLIFKKEKEANDLFQEAWDKVLPETKTGAPLREEALLLKKSIEENLFSLNKIKNIEEPEVLSEFKPEEINLIPQKMLVLNSVFYFFNPFSSNLYQFEIKKGGTLLKSKTNLKLGTVFSDSILFFSNPNILISLKNGVFQEKILEPASADFHFDKLSSFKLIIYFLDTQSGEIVKYSELESKEVPPQFWLNPKTKKPVGAKSMAIDSDIWVLTKNNEINRYAGGFYQKTLKLELWPYLKNPTKILTSPDLPHLYLLEPTQNRIIILGKTGEIIKQFQSEKFDNLLDFSVSEDGKTIYLLNGLKVYQILDSTF